MIIVIQREDDMEEYVEKYGKHFNEKLLTFAVNRMHHTEQPNILTKEQVDKLLEKYNINLSHKHLLDYVFVANMGLHDYYQSSIMDEAHLAKYIYDVLEDEDGYCELSFCRWYADIEQNEIDIDWNDMI